MGAEKFSIAVLCVLVVFALFISGTSGMAGNITSDLGLHTNPLIGLGFLVVFLVAVLLILRNLRPEI